MSQPPRADGCIQLASCCSIVKRHCIQGNLQKKALNWGLAYSSSEPMAIMAGSTAAGRQGTGAESSHLTHKQEAEGDSLRLAGVLETSKSTPSDLLTLPKLIYLQGSKYPNIIPIQTTTSRCLVLGPHDNTKSVQSNFRSPRLL